MNPCETPCERAFNYNSGRKGRNADKTKLLLVANHSDSRTTFQASLIREEGIDYELTLLKTQTGRNLVEMLKSCGLTLEDIYFTNIFKCLLPEDREPKREEYEACLKMLEGQVREFGPRGIIALSHQAYRFMFPEEKSKHLESIGRVLRYKEVPTFISLHPRRIWSLPLEERLTHYQKVKEFLSSLQGPN